MRALLLALSALAGHWRRRPVQLAAMLLGLAAATALWSGVQALNAEARAAYADAADTLGAGAAALVAADGGTIAQADMIALRRAGWPVSPVLEGAVTLGGQPLAVTGVELLTLPAGMDMSGGGAGAGDGDIAAFLTPPGRTWMAAETMRRLGLRPGDAPATDAGARLPPVHPRANMSAGAALMDIGAAQAALGMTDRVSRLVLAGRNSLTAPPLADVAPTLRPAPARDGGDLNRLTASFHLNLTAFGLLAFVVGLFIVHSAAGLALEQRLETLRTIRALGVSRRALAGALMAEILGFALLAGLVGVMLGYVVASLLLPGVGLTLRGLYGAPAPGELAIRPQWWLSGLGMSVLGAAVAMGAGLARFWRAPLLSVGRPAARMAALARVTGIQAGAAAMLVGACAALAAWGQGLAAGFAAMAALLSGAALALPPLLAALLRLGQALTRRARSPLVRWFWADARAEAPALSLALMALLLALGASIGVGAMVGGFRIAFTDWLDRRLPADVYVSAVQPGALADAQAFLMARADVRAALPMVETQTRVGDWPVELRGVTDDAAYRASWPVLDGALQDTDWDALARGEAVLVSEQTARRLDLSRGDRLTLPAPGGDWAPPVAGIYSDYGNPRGQALMSLSALQRHWPDARPRDLEVFAAPGAAGDVAAALRARFGPALGPVLEQDAVRRLSLTVFERTFAVTAALSAFILTVAGAALLASLTALGGRRLPRLAPVWAMGVTRRALARMELARTLTLAALTALLAVPLGVALTWLLVAVINVAAFGWRLPFHVFPMDWLRMLGFALLAALLAGAGPMLRLARTRPAALAGVFAHER